MATTSIMNDTLMQRLMAGLERSTLMRLFAGGAIGLLVWEIWARVITKFVLGYPLEPAGLIDAIAQHQFGLSVPYLLREALHYAVGIIGYPVAYFVLSRLNRNIGFWLDAVVFASFSLAVIALFIAGKGSMGIALFWLVATGLIATRLINPSHRLREAISWGTFTWLNALGLMAPLGGLSFYLLGEGGDLSFMSFVGHVIYGFIAAWLFEHWMAKTM